jgi:phosphoenolpyruvate-protein kinase (PTS system EI component)
MSKHVRLTILLGVMVCVVALPIMAGAGTTSEDVAKEAEKTWATFKSYLHDQKGDAVAYGKDLMKKADSEIGELENKAAGASADAKEEYHQAILNLRKLESEASAKLDALGESSGQAWESAKDGFAKAYQDLADAYSEAAAKFK